MLSALKELTDTEEGDRQAHGCLKSGGDLKGDWLPARRGRGAAGRKEQDIGAHTSTLERAYTVQCSQGAVSGLMAGLIFALIYRALRHVLGGPASLGLCSSEAFSYRELKQADAKGEKQQKQDRMC